MLLSLEPRKQTCVSSLAGPYLSTPIAHGVRSSRRRASRGQVCFLSSKPASLVSPRFQAGQVCCRRELANFAKPVWRHDDRTWPTRDLRPRLAASPSAQEGYSGCMLGWGLAKSVRLAQSSFSA